MLFKKVDAKILIFLAFPINCLIDCILYSFADIQLAEFIIGTRRIDPVTKEDIK